MNLPPSARGGKYNPIRSRHASQSGSVRLNDFNASATFKIIVSPIFCNISFLEVISFVILSGFPIMRI